jgi:O-antigen ligase
MKCTLLIQIILILTLIASGLRPINDPLTGIILLTITAASTWTITARKTWMHYPLSTWMLAYLAWLFIIAFTSTIPSTSMMTLAVLACLPVIFLAFTNTPLFSKSWGILTYTFAIFGVGSAIWAILQVYLHLGYAFGPLNDRNALAALMNLLWFPTVYLFLQSTKNTNKIKPVLLGVGIFLMSTALFATMSRGGIATWLLLQPVLLWAIFKFNKSIKMTAIIPMICLLAFLSSSIILKNNVMERNFALPKDLNVELNKENNFASSNDRSTLLRILLLKSTLEIALDNPVLGTGWGTFANHYPAYRDKAENHTPILYTHNDYLQLASEGGFLTPLLLIAILIGLLKLLIQNLRNVRNEAGFESVILLLGALTVFIHANLNFIFYYAFMSTIAGLYLARASILSQQPKVISLSNLMLFRPYARRIVAGFIILMIALPFVTRQISMSTLTNSQTGLKIINAIFPNVTASNIAKLITSIYPKESIAQEFNLLEIEDILANSNFNDSTHFDIKSQFLNDAIMRFDFVRAQTANNPDIGVREAKVLINYHSFFNEGLAYSKASEVLEENLKMVPYHPDTYIMLSRLQKAKGDSVGALKILHNAEKRMINQLDHRLIYVELLRQQSKSTEIEELNNLENDIKRVRIHIESGKRYLVPKNFGPNLDMRLSAIEKKITSK